MLNQSINYQKSLRQLAMTSLCLVIVAACATNPKENNDGSQSASQRLSRIKNTGSSKEAVKQSPAEDAQSEQGQTEEQEENSDANESLVNLQDKKAEQKTKTENTKVQENYESSSSEYILPKAKKKVRPQPEVSKELKDAYKDALKSMEKGLKNKEFEQALEQFKAIEAQNPQFSGPSTNIGMIYMHQEKFADAELAFKKAIEINNENEYAYNNLGLAYRELGKFPEAKQSYQSAIELNPKYAEAYYNLGILAELYLQDLELAIQSFEYYKLANKKKDEQVDTWLIDLRNRLQTQVAAQSKAPAAQEQTPQTNESTPATPENNSSSEEAQNTTEAPVEEVPVEEVPEKNSTENSDNTEVENNTAESNSIEEDSSVESETGSTQNTEELEGK